MNTSITISKQAMGRMSQQTAVFFAINAIRIDGGKLQEGVVLQHHSVVETPKYGLEEIIVNVMMKNGIPCCFISMSFEHEKGEYDQTTR